MKMSSTAGKKMGEETQSCKYFCSDYCKFLSSCNIIHHKETLIWQIARTIIAKKRQPKICRYKSNCTRGKNCLYKYQIVVCSLNETKELQNKLNDENEQLVREIKVLTEKVNKTEQDLKLEKDNHK